MSPLVRAATGRRLATGWIAVWGLAVCVAATAHAASFTVSPKTYKKLEAAHEAIGEKRYSEAREALDSIDGRSSLNAHEQALVHQTYGYIESSQERYPAAIKRFEQCLALNALPEPTMLTLEYDVAQIYIATEQYEKGITKLKSWMAKADNPGAAAYQLLATAHVQLKQYDAALPHAKTAVEKSTRPNEGRLQLLLSIYLEKQSYRPAGDLLEQLLQHFPRKSYWKQLSAIYGQLDRPKDSLAILQLAHVQGYLTDERDLRNLAQLYLFNGIPYRAAKLLADGIETKKVQPNEKTWNLLAESWLAAREYDRAVEPLETVGRLTGDGGVYVRLARVHIARNDWTKAQRALERALDSRKLDDRGQAYLLLGICASHADDLSTARRAFGQARAFEAQRNEADRWLEHVSHQEARRRRFDT